MRFATIIQVAAVSVTTGSYALAGGGITAPDVTVGRNLQTAVTVQLSDPRPREMLKLTVSSDDPSRLLVSEAQDKAGSASITLYALPQFTRSPTFWLQSLADGGSTTYTVSGEGVGRVTATAKLTASAIVIIGPLREPKVSLTPRATPAKITVVSAAIGAEGKVAEQSVAGGSQLEVAISNSEPKVGKLRAPKLVLRGGFSFEETLFEPAAEGETTLTPVQPPGFTAARQYASVVVAVAKPGMGIEGNVYLGKDLQIVGSVILGEPAPPDGLEVTITSADPAKLVLSLDEHRLGSGSIQVRIPAGAFIGTYYLQALGDSGIVECEGKAPGYRTRVTRVGLAKSGVIVSYDAYGPPDEASVLRKEGLNEDRPFFVSLSKQKDQNTKVVAWSAYLDPVTGQAADITVQPLRAGVKAIVNLTSSHPEVGAIESPLTIESGKSCAISRFTPRTKGVTVIEVETPAGFATPKNATRIPANVSD